MECSAGGRRINHRESLKSVICLGLSLRLQFEPDRSAYVTYFLNTKQTWNQLILKWIGHTGKCVWTELFTLITLPLLASMHIISYQKHGNKFFIYRNNLADLIQVVKTLLILVTESKSQILLDPECARWRRTPIGITIYNSSWITYKLK
jgi:hypothetical protein